MSEDSEPKTRKRIKSLSIRFNKEVFPFQHIKIEATSNITNKDDPDEVKNELIQYVKEALVDAVQHLYGTTPKGVSDDNVPY